MFKFFLKKVYNFIEIFIPVNILTILFIRFSYLFSRQKVVKKSTDKKIKLLENISMQLRKSDKLFILGSGYSINNITKEQWNIISENDSVGFNFWLIHDFIPSFYVFEESQSQERNQIFYTILNNKKHLYVNTPFIIKDVEKHYVKLSNIPDEIKKNLYISTNIFVINRKMTMKKNLSKVLKVIRKYLKNKNKNSVGVIFNRRASLCYLIILGYLLGYKEIILCGVDLNDNRYFFDDERYNDALKPDNNMFYTSKHPTDMEHSCDTIGISELIFYINKEILLPEKIVLSIGNSSSKLTDFLPLYNWEK